MQALCHLIWKSHRRRTTTNEKHQDHQVQLRRNSKFAQATANKLAFSVTSSVDLNMKVNQLWFMDIMISGDTYRNFVMSTAPVMVSGG